MNQTVGSGEPETVRRFPDANIASNGDVSPLVSCHRVTKEYTRGTPSGFRWWRRNNSPQPTVTALDGITLSIDPGEFIGIEGPSGSGKSTLLHLLAGLDTPTSGTVELTGIDIATLSERARAKLRLETVGLVFQRFHLLPSLTARSNVSVPLVERGVSRREREEHADALLTRVGLRDRLTHTPGEMSGGEQQRVAIARALTGDPPLIIADEPTGELDTETGESILDLFDELVANGRTVIVASHDPPTLARTDRQIVLRDGKCVDE